MNTMADFSQNEKTAIFGGIVAFGGVMAILFIFILPMVYGQQSQTEQDLQYQAKLDYCYGLYADISDDFGWFFQAQKKTQYNQNCGELTGYISED
jgi:hypothetical protein